MDLTLFFAPGAFSRVPMIALEEAGAPFETRLVAFMAGEHRAPAYLALNPAGKVPLLVVDGVTVAQNSAILPLLAAVVPGRGTAAGERRCGRATRRCRPASASSPPTSTRW